jgi:hypothetical protein
MHRQYISQNPIVNTETGFSDLKTVIKYTLRAHELAGKNTILAQYLLARICTFVGTIDKKH